MKKFYLQTVIWVAILLYATTNILWSQIKVIKDFGEDDFISSLSAFAGHNGKMYFLAGTDNNNQLYRSSGTVESTERISDIENIRYMAISGDNIFYSDGVNLWMYSEISGTNTLLHEYSEVQPRLIPFDSSLVYYAHHTGEGASLNISDGTPEGTKYLLPYDNMMSWNWANYGNFEYNGNLYFVPLYFIEGGYSYNVPLCITDGTANGTEYLAEFSFWNPWLWNPFYTPLNGALYFGTQSYNGSLWKTDGTKTGTTMVKQIHQGAGNANIGNIVNLNNNLIFMANDIVHGAEVWYSDGTSDGTTMLKDINPGEGSAFPAYFDGAESFVELNGELFFRANDGIHGDELWKTDGTENGTVMVSDIRPGELGSYPHYLTKFKQSLYFISDDGENGIELWKTDGTAQGTHQVGDINHQANNLSIIALFAEGEYLYFATVDVNQNVLLYSYSENARILSFTPTSIQTSQTDTVITTGIGTISAIRINGVESPYTRNQDTLFVTVPFLASSGPITIEDENGIVYSIDYLKVTNEIRLDSTSDFYLLPGNSLMVYGNRFSDIVSVNFGTTSSTDIEIFGNDSLSVVVPGSIVNGNISLIFNEGVFLTSQRYEVIRIGGFYPRSAFPGETLYIAGNHLGEAVNIEINGLAVNDFQAIHDDTLAISVPEGATTGFITVTIPEGALVSSASLRIKTPTSFEGVDVNENIVVYPNPTDGRFYINGKGITGTVNLTLRDICGKTIYSSVLESSNGNLHAELQLTGLKKGVYTLHIKNREISSIKKVSIE